MKTLIILASLSWPLAGCSNADLAQLPADTLNTKQEPKLNPVFEIANLRARKVGSALKIENRGFNSKPFSGTQPAVMPVVDENQQAMDEIVTMFKTMNSQLEHCSLIEFNRQLEDLQADYDLAIEKVTHVVFKSNAKKLMVVTGYPKIADNWRASIEESNYEAKQFFLQRIASERRLCEKRNSDLEMIANGKIGELLDPRESRK